MTDVAGRVVLITGGAGGLGRALATRLAARGGHVALWDRDAHALERAAEEVAAASGRRPHVDAVDVTDPAQLDAGLAAVRQALGAVSVLVNNAGVASAGRLADLDDDAITATLAVNAVAPLLLTKRVLPDLVARDSGHVVTIASAVGLQGVGVARLSAYTASKRAAVGLHESVRHELRQEAPGVAHTLVCPYFIDTGLFAGTRPRWPRMLDLAPVADATVRAIERDRPLVRLPWLIRLVPVLNLLPTALTDRLADAMGVHRALETFEGRSST